MAERSTFKLTYATMFDPPDELHTRYEEEVAKLKNNLGQEYGMIINGEEVFSDDKFEDRSPINTDWVLGVFQKGNEKHAESAIKAAREAFRNWGRMKWQERVALMRAAADIIDQRIFEFGAVMSMEVGKNRMEAMGDAAESADLIRFACDQMEKNEGYRVKMGQDPLVGYTATNYSLLRPYGVWLIVSPFNFPAALAGGPAGAALVAGNAVVMKPATDTPFTGRLLAECFRDAGLPKGVFNYVTGPGKTLGQALIESDDVDGITFTGSYAVGMGIYRTFAKGKYVRPVVLELGGKNPTIVSKNADLDRAAQGIIRSAFGLQGQKCSAASRIFIQEEVYDDLVARLKEMAKKLKVGDPCERDVFMGPVINKSAYEDFQKFAGELHKSGERLVGGEILTEGDYSKGYFCSPTIMTDVDTDHKLWKHEMFLPITMLHKVKTLEEAMDLANSVDYGLTAGFYGSGEETEWFFDNIEAGVTYANRPQGATTGAWPGFQPFGGWKASGSSGKNAGGPYYLTLYMHEQSQTLID